jgi:hypothetical protein
MGACRDPGGLSGLMPGSRKGWRHWSTLHDLTLHEMTNFHANKETMIISRFFIFSLAMAGCATAAYAIGRHTRHLEKQQHKEDLRTWEDEGGNLAPSEARAMARPAIAA